MTKIVVGAALSFVAGWVDALCYFKLKLFTAHVTGNIVLLFVALGMPGERLLGKLLSVPAFILVLWAVSLAAEALGMHRPRTFSLLLVVQALLLGATMALGVRLNTLPDLDQALPMATAMLAVAAMAVQNALGGLGQPQRPATTAMTQNMSRAAVDVARLLHRRGDDEERRRAKQRFQRLWPLLVAFAAGCAGGAGFYGLSGFWGLLAPIGVLLVLAASSCGRLRGEEAG